MLFESPRVRLITQYRIATLTVDLSDQQWAALEDLDSALTIVHGHSNTDILILRGFDGGFGSRFDGLSDPGTSALGQRVADRLARLDAITVAWIDGPCLGGALELALACDFRAAAGGAATRLGFPQVAAGGTPCWGGVVRLPRLVGIAHAVHLLVHGEKLSAGQALAAGLIDRAFGPRIASVQLDTFVLKLQAGGAKPQQRRPWPERLVWRRELRRIVHDLHRQMSPDHLAAQVTLRSISAAVRLGPAEGAAAERAAAGKLSEIAPRWTNRPPEKVAPQLPFERITILGGGTIGAALAQWASLHGCTVAVRDLDPWAARERLRAQFADAAHRRLINHDDCERRCQAVHCTDTWDGFANADLVIEAIPESQSRKRAALAELERIVRPATVIATTSTVMPVHALARSLRNPERLLGLHVVHPAAAVRAVELTAGPATDPAILARMKSWLTSCGKVTMQSRDRPGRVLGRVLLPYLHEAILLATEGGSITDIDAAARQFGFAWGPFAALDAIGLDVVRASLNGLRVVYGPELTPPSLLKRLTRSGWLGHKTGAGFYRYGRGEPCVHKGALPWPSNAVRPQEAITRLVARLVNAAFSAVELHLNDADTIDRLVVASGWPAFRGGPIRYAHSRGLARVARQMQRMADQLGPRFAPCRSLTRPSASQRRLAA